MLFVGRYNFIKSDGFDGLRVVFFVGILERDFILFSSTVNWLKSYVISTTGTWTSISFSISLPTELCRQNIPSEVLFFSVISARYSTVSKKFWKRIHHQWSFPQVLAGSNKRLRASCSELNLNWTTYLYGLIINTVYIIAGNALLVVF